MLFVSPRKIGKWDEKYKKLKIYSRKLCFGCLKITPIILFNLVSQAVKLPKPQALNLLFYISSYILNDILLMKPHKS